MSLSFWCHSHVCLSSFPSNVVCPLEQITESTLSLDWTCVENDGRLDGKTLGGSQSVASIARVGGLEQEFIMFVNTNVTLKVNGKLIKS